MNRTVLGAIATVLLLGAGCNAQPTGEGPAACNPIAPLPIDGGVIPEGGIVPEGGVVWGFADLHAHPAVEVGFGGRFIWGTALDSPPVDANQLPMIQSCPVETHDRNASSPVDNFVGGLLFPQVTKVTSFAHAPVGDLNYRTSKAWPNARDPIHQSMNIASIRRAYEGGLRLMFASTTDSQVLGNLLAGPSMNNGLVPDPNYDFNSAEQQLIFIDRIIEQNKNWMGLAKSPGDARSIIQSGRLAVVLSVEMDGLTQGQLDQLVDDFGVSHVVPIHLVDNDIGGTAANSNIFNAASAEVSEMFRCDHKPLDFLDVAATTWFSNPLGWGQTLVPDSIPLYVDVSNISFPWYQGLNYEPLGYCDTPNVGPSRFVQVGQMNYRGLCTTAAECLAGGRPGRARIAHMMNRHLIVDVSHMGYRAVADTLKVSPGDEFVAAPNGGACSGPTPPPVDPKPSYPLIASHGDIAHLCPTFPAPGSSCHDSALAGDPVTQSAGSERSVDSTQARELLKRQGVLGLTVGVGEYRSRTVLEARGGPLLTFNASGATTGCVVATGVDTGAAGCAIAPTVAPIDAAPDMPVDALEVQTLGGVDSLAGSPNSVPFAHVELVGPDGQQFQTRVIRVPLSCSNGGCSATVPLGTPDAPLPFANQPDGLGLAGDSGDGGTTPGSTLYPDGAVPPAPMISAALHWTLNQISNVQVEWRDLDCDGTCQQASSTAGSNYTCQANNAPGWTIEQASVVADTPSGPVPIIQVGPYPTMPVARLGERGSFWLFGRGDRPRVGSDVPADGHLLRVSLVSGPEQQLLGASASQAGANVCVALRQRVGGVCKSATPPAPGAYDCPPGWVEMNQRGLWARSAKLYAFARTTVPESAICGADVVVLDWDPSSEPWTVDELTIEASEDPVGRFIRRYADVTNELADGEMGRVAFGTDANGFNGLLDISENPVPWGTALEASACLVTPGGASTSADGGPAPAQPLAPMRFLDNGTLGDQVLMEERGLATYGHLADMMAIIDSYNNTCGHQVHDSLMLSAEATIRAWENILKPGTWTAKDALPKMRFDCGPPPGPSP